jgi:CRP-like cAMP-binding protein
MGIDDTAPTWSMACEGLSDEQRRRVERHLRQREFAPRSRIFIQGEPGDAMLFVASGRIRLFYSSENGEEYTYRISSPGYLIGLISAILDKGRVLSAESIERTTMQVLTQSDLFMLMESIPRFAANVARLLATMAMGSIVRSGPLALDSASVRLGKIMSGLAVPDDGDASRPLYTIRGLSHNDLARMVGVTRPWITQTLASFEKRNLISRKKHLITIVDMAAFERLFSDPERK